MTISAISNRVSYAGDGSTTAFSVSYPFFLEGELLVIIETDSDGSEAEQTLTTDYTVSGGAGSTGTVTMVTAPASGETLHIIRDTDAVQKTDLVNNSAMDAETLEDALDRRAMREQRLFEHIERALRVPETEAALARLPKADDRKDHFLYFDDTTGLPVVKTKADLGLDDSATSGENVAGYSALKARSTSGLSDGDSVFVTHRSSVGDGGHGWFAWRTGDQSTNVTNDPGEGVWVPPDSDATGASGAWERLYESAINVKWFGATGDGTTDDTAAIQNAFDFASDGELIVFPGNHTYKTTMQAGTSPQDFATADGDTTIDLPADSNVYLRDKKNVVVDLRGATITPGDGYAFLLYKCVGCQIIGGLFNGDGQSRVDFSNEPSNLLIARSIDCVGAGIESNNSYRNLYVYRCYNSGFSRCSADWSEYWACYGAGSLDVTVDGRTHDESQEWSVYFDNCTATRGKKGSFLIEEGRAHNCKAYDARIDGSDVVHFAMQTGPFDVQGCTVFDDNSQNSGNLVDGFVVATTASALPSNLHASRSKLVGNRVVGCYRAYRVRGAESILIANNQAYDYWLTGFQLVSDVLSGSNAAVRGVILSGNIAGPFNSSTTRTQSGNNKKAGFQIEKNTADLLDIVFTGNLANTDNRGNLSPSGTYYEIYIESPTGLVYSDNVIAGNGSTNGIPTDYVVGSFSRDMTTASGTQAITGVGFKPRYVEFIAAKTNSPGASIGFDDGITPRVMADVHNATANAWLTSGTISILWRGSGTPDDYKGIIQSFDDDGFTISWTKVNAPTGTLGVTFVAHR